MTLAERNMRSEIAQVLHRKYIKIRVKRICRSFHTRDVLTPHISFVGTNLIVHEWIIHLNSCSIIFTKGFKILFHYLPVVSEAPLKMYNSVEYWNSCFRQNATTTIWMRGVSMILLKLCFFQTLWFWSKSVLIWIKDIKLR